MNGKAHGVIMGKSVPWRVHRDDGSDVVVFADSPESARRIHAVQHNAALKIIGISPWNERQEVADIVQENTTPPTYDELVNAVEWCAEEHNSLRCNPEFDNLLNRIKHVPTEKDSQ